MSTDNLEVTPDAIDQLTPQQLDRLRNLLIAPVPNGPTWPTNARATQPKLTTDERAVLDHLVLAWKVWSTLDDVPDSDNADFGFHLHALQRIVGFRLVRRSDVEYFQ
jgi:hypothetical protein